jgi:hypothetical protein
LQRRLSLAEQRGWLHPPPPLPGGWHLYSINVVETECVKAGALRDTINPLSSAEALVFLGFNITMRYISLHFTWRILEHERSRWAKERS